MLEIIIRPEQFIANSGQHAKASPALLVVLMKVNGLQMLRRFKSVREQSRLLTGLISLSLAGYLGLSFWLFSKGLSFMAAFPGLGTVLVERLLYLLFAFLFGLLLLSNLVISYTNFFRNNETNFLFTLPVPWQTIFRWKFIESTLLASWAFLFLIAPLLGAFGLSRGVRWHFYLETAGLIGLFIVLPGVAGCWLAILLARYLDRRSFQVVALVGVALLVLLGCVWWKAQPATDELLETRVLDMLDQLLLKTRFAQYAFLPSYWLSASLLQMAEGAFQAAAFFALVLLSNVSLFGFLAFTRLGNTFYETAAAAKGRASILEQWPWFSRGERQRVASAGKPGSIERLFNRLTFLRRDRRSLLLKDSRTFWRDTTQWGQTVMLFGLLGAYVINLRHFTHQLTSSFWINLVAYLNLGACALNLATLTTRFVFPQFSLEGHRLWIVGMAPMGLARVVKTKYWLASFSSLILTLSLISLSSYLLLMSWTRILFFGVVMTVMTFGLNGLAVGLGVLYPNLKETSPSKIVSGFGGTLCLVLSFLYIVSSVLLLGFGATGPHANRTGLILSLSGFSLLTAGIGWLPLHLGIRRLRCFEY